MQSHKQRKGKEEDKSSVRKHTNLLSSYFSTFDCCFHWSINLRSLDSQDETHIFPSIIAMKRLSIFRLEDAYLKMSSSVPDAWFSVPARRISMAKEWTSTKNALCLVRESKSKSPFLSKCSRYNNSKLTARWKIVPTQDSAWGLLQTRIRDTAFLLMHSSPFLHGRLLKSDRKK